jgi:hypothetical protein
MQFKHNGEDDYSPSTDFLNVPFSIFNSKQINQV